MPNKRELDTSEITRAVSRLAQEANFRLPDDVYAAIEKAADREESPRSREILRMMLDNNRIASNENIPLCQDTGMAVVFIEIGQDVSLTGAAFEDAVNEGVRTGYEEGYLRKSVAAEPAHGRVNTGDNTPAVLHSEIVPGDRVKITVFIKGGGSESVGAAAVIKPSDGLNGLKNFVLDAVRAAGPKPCPPMIVGIGIGGTLDAAGLMAKKALLIPLDTVNPNENLRLLEKELETEINQFGVGPAGLGGRITCLGVRIIDRPSHIATMPVAVDISCYCLRRKTVIL
jgi:fumarate hydratase subunit alpha